MNTAVKEKLAKKLIAILGKDDAIELIEDVKGNPTKLSKLLSDLLALLNQREELMEEYLKKGKASLAKMFELNDSTLEFEVSRSSDYSETWPQFDVVVFVSEGEVIAAELILGKMKETLRKAFRASSCPRENASLGKVSIAVKKN